jgi:hypothetical protein
MLGDLLLNIIYGIIWTLTLPFRLFDDVSIANDFANAVATSLEYMSIFDYFIPFTTLFICFGIIIFIRYAHVLFNLLSWAIKKLPFIN